MISSADEFGDELAAYSRTLEALPPPSPECRAAYSEVYARDPLTIGIFFGFINTSRKNYVADGDFKRALVRQLTKNCRGNDQACGFAAADREPAPPGKSVLFKTQNGRNVEIDVFDSSVGSEYSADVARLSDEQESKSRLVTEEYLAALGRDAVVFYAGHSRYGSGSGFYPPLSFSKIGRAAVLRPPLISRIGDALRHSASPPALLGMFSCDSSEYYAGRIHALAPRTSLLVSSGASSHENSLLSLLGALNLVLTRSCYGEAAQSINPDASAPVFHLYGLFDQLPHPHYIRYHNALQVLAALLLIPILVLLVAGRAELPAPRPARAPDPAPTGFALLVLSLCPCFLIVRAFGGRIAAPLPLLMTLMGFCLLPVSVARSRTSAGVLFEIAGRVLPYLLVCLLLYFGLSLVHEISPENALSAFRQSLMLAFVFYLILPFVLFSEDVLLVPYLSGNGSDFAPSLVISLLFYVVVWLALCALAPVFKPMLWPIAASVLYVRTFSVLLYRRKPHFLIPAVFLTATLAVIFTEGMHALMYR